MTANEELGHQRRANALADARVAPRRGSLAAGSGGGVPGRPGDITTRRNRYARVL
jgi:hypothetical protein